MRGLRRAAADSTSRRRKEVVVPSERMGLFSDPISSGAVFCSKSRTAAPQSPRSQSLRANSRGTNPNLLCAALGALALGLLVTPEVSRAQLAPFSGANPALPQISITHVPPSGAGANTHGTIKGRVGGVSLNRRAWSCMRWEITGTFSRRLPTRSPLSETEEPGSAQPTWAFVMRRCWSARPSFLRP